MLAIEHLSTRRKNKEQWNKRNELQMDAPKKSLQAQITISWKISIWKRLISPHVWIKEAQILKQCFQEPFSQKKNWTSFYIFACTLQKLTLELVQVIQKRTKLVLEIEYSFVQNY